MKDQIRKLLIQEVPYSKIEEVVGCSKATISYHAKQLGLGKQQPRYNWKEIACYYDTHSVTETREYFGFCKATWDLAISRGDIKSRGRSDYYLTFDDILVENSSYSTYHLKMRLWENNLLDKKCSECGLGEEWQERPIALQLDHINGNSKDHRIDNLRILCPNCHSQTPTYAGKNKGTNIIPG